jgi:hypothetical protein
MSDRLHFPRPDYSLFIIHGELRPNGEEETEVKWVRDVVSIRRGEQGASEGDAEGKAGLGGNRPCLDMAVGDESGGGKDGLFLLVFF